MDKPLPSAEHIFAQAIECASGATRKEFVTAQCGDDVALLREVESLLRAHEQAGDFLRSPAEREETSRIRPASVSRQGTAVMNAAAYAEAFLHRAATQGDEQGEAYVASLPKVVRREAQERIQAGLRVRQMHAA